MTNNLLSSLKNKINLTIYDAVLRWKIELDREYIIMLIYSKDLFAYKTATNLCLANCLMSLIAIKHCYILILFTSVDN